MRDLYLTAFSLFSKFGFDDGDVLQEWIYDAEDSGLVEYYRFEGVDDHAALTQLVTEHLLPRVPGEFTICHIETIHNPIRVDTWHGQEWDDYANDAPPEVEDISVDIPAATVLDALTAAMEDE